MPEQRIDPVLVEKAAKAVWDAEWEREKALGPNPWGEQDEELRVEIRLGAAAAIRVVFDELEHWAAFECPHGHKFALAPGEDLGRARCAICGCVTLQRILWRPVEQGDVK